MRTFLSLFRHISAYYIVSSLQKFTQSNSIVEYLRKKFSLDAKISCVMQETKIFTKASPPQLEAVKKKFSLDVNISCVMQETKIFHQGPPP